MNMWVTDGPCPVFSWSVSRRQSPAGFLQVAPQFTVMSLTTEDFTAFMARDPDDDEEIPLGEALDEVAVDVETDAVEAVREPRERF